MKIMLLLLTFYLMTINCNDNTEENSFFLELNYSIKELSKDSNSQTTNIKIKNKIIEYSVTHGGRDPRTDIKKIYKLTNEKELKLISNIKKNKLNQNIKENIDDVSPGINVSLSLEIIIEKDTTKSEICGAVNIWGSNKKNNNTIRNKGYFNKIHSLLVFMKNDLGYNEIEI